jgi:CheY-like chemotaxis protein
LPAAPELDSVREIRTERQHSRARVLVVDDEVAVVRTIRRVLAKDHEVAAFHDPRDALALLESGKEFDLILCDLMMPYVTGQDLFARAVSIAPELADRFVFITGGATDPRAQSFLAELSNERLDKPFSAADLARLVGRCTSQS